MIQKSIVAGSVENRLGQLLGETSAAAGASAGDRVRHIVPGDVKSWVTSAKRKTSRTLFLRHVFCKAIVIVSSILIASTAHRAQAVELLTDGSFEFATSIPGWELEESIFDQTTMMPRNIGDIDSAEQRGFGPESGPFALWLRAFVGGAAPSPDALTNAVLSQSVAATEGETYTFIGHSRWELNYSGGVNTLQSSGPLGGVQSPTDTTLEMAFLDAGGSVLGTPTVLDLRTEQNNFDYWVQHTLMETAPAGTTQVRVTAAARQMLWNGGGNESAFFDTFSLQSDSAVGTELLMNPDLDLDDPQMSFDPIWEITEVAGGNIPDDATISTANFANRPESGGQLGAWLRSFTGNEAEPADAILSQTVPGMPGGEYTFSAWSNFQVNYSGGNPSFGTQTLMELAFLDATGVEIGTPLMLDIAAEQMNDNTWREHVLNGIAPAGTVSVRVTAAGLDMETNPAGGQQSAFFDDFSLDGPGGGGVSGDFNSDGSWDCADINALTGAIAAGSTDLSFDMNGDGSVTLADVTAVGDGWLAVGGANNPAETGGNPFLMGDANLDGSTDVSDFNIWNGNKFTSVDAWCLGDFNADGSADVSDFNVWNGNKFTNSAGLVAVPEPSTRGCVLILACLFWIRRRGAGIFDNRG